MNVASMLVLSRGIQGCSVATATPDPGSYEGLATQCWVLLRKGSGPMAAISTDAHDQILEQLANGAAILFLGAGSTRNCRNPDGSKGLTGDELATEILQKLNKGKKPKFSVSLTEAAEYFATWNAGARAALDKFIQERLKNLQPTIGHYIATTFPWRAIITTNYNKVMEDCYTTAVGHNYAANQILPIRTDEDLVKHAGNSTHTRLFKPHGCISVQWQEVMEQKNQRMVVTSLDYFESERIRPKMYQAIRALCETCTTVFIGYSMADYTFRNIFYRLYSNLGEWTARSYSIGPVSPDLRFDWMARSLDKSFNTTLINDAFDTFMIRLAVRRGHISPLLKQQILANWGYTLATNKGFTTGLIKKSISSLKEC